MTTEQAALEVIHSFGVICLVASLLIRVLPSPEEITSRHYKIFYGVIRRCSLNAGIRSNGNGGNSNGTTAK